MTEDRLPVALLTGFLGSGKTSLLRRALAGAAWAETAVLINELGEIGLDHYLVDTVDGPVLELPGGCLCCAVREDLAASLRQLLRRRDQGAVPAFRRIAIETTGLADPAPILHLLMSEPALVRHHRLDGVITTVDAVNGDGQLDDHYEAAKQVALADRLVVTKTDIAPPDAVAALAGRLRALNAAAPILPVVAGQVAPEALFAPAASPGAEIDRWLRTSPGHDHAHRQGDAGHDHDHDRHHGIATFCLVHDLPVPWPALKAWLEALTSLRGADFLRMKGIVNVAGRDGPVVIHGVQHVFHPPRQLARWPDEDRRTRVVFITRNIGAAAVEASFAHALRSA